MNLLAPSRHSERSTLAKIRIGLLVVVAATLVVLHLLACLAALRNGYYPTSSDEIDYVKSVEYFLLNGKPYAFSTFDELYSANGSFSFHGPIYTLMFGVPQLLSGLHSVHFILYANIVLSIATIELLLCIPSGTERRLLAIAILVSSPVFFVYATSFMMETLQILLSVILAGVFSVLLARPVLGLALPLLFGFTRQSNFLYSVAIFAGRNPARRLILLAACWVGMLIVLLLEIHFFHAPFPGGKFSDVIKLLGQFDIAGATRQLILNVSNGLVQYFSRWEDGPFYLVAKYTFFSATIYSVVSGYIRHDRTLLAAGLVGLAFFGALVALYDVHGWRDLRSLAGVTIFLVGILSRQASGTYLLYIILVVQLMAFPSLFRYRADFNEQRVVPFIQKFGSSGDEIAAYKRLSTLPPTQSGREFILIDVEKGLFSTDMSVEYLSLPVRSDDGVPIRYTFTRNGVAGDSKVDYRLSSRACPGSMAILTTHYFHVCRNPSGR